jgi:hypothetical protein
MVVVGGALRTIVPQLLPFSLMLYVTTVTSILLEIHGRTSPITTVYSSHQDAAGVFLSEIRTASERQGRCELAWIGVTMQSAWLTLENALGRAIEDTHCSDLHIRLLQSDPDYLATILGGDSNTPQLTREQWQHIARFSQRNADALRASRSTIEIAQYGYMPNYHGLLINDEILYLATVRWNGRDSSELSVPHEPFERFDRSTERGRYMISLYKSWFDKGYRTATRISRFPESTIAQENGKPASRASKTNKPAPRQAAAEATQAGTNSNTREPLIQSARNDKGVDTSERPKNSLHT